jgi:methylamine dehydrogenase heavy chain
MQNTIRQVLKTTLLAGGFAATAALAEPPVLTAEVSDTAVLTIGKPHRFYTMAYDGGAVIFDGDNGRIEGLVPMAMNATLDFSADNTRIYVGETMYTRGNRGDRIDLLSIYDASTLNLLKEIPVPPRAPVNMKYNNMSLSPSGQRAYIYNLHPATSITWVDLKQEKVGGTVEVPGCTMAFAWGETGVSSVCGDGSLAMVTAPDAGAATVTHTKRFFDAAVDPVFDNSLYDNTTGRAVFLSYTGLIHEVELSAKPVISKPWSVQVSAGYSAAGTGTDELAWRPGGRQPIAWHKASDKLYVLMHTGPYWSHNDTATEIWVLDRKTHALLNRWPSPMATRSISVSQDAQPQLYLVSMEAPAIVMDANTGEVLRSIEAGLAEATTQAGH